MPRLEKEDTRGRILEAAAQVFAEYGFERATVREIVYRAGTNLAAVNYHFGDKASLYEEALRHRRDGPPKHIEPPALPDGRIEDPRPILKSFLMQAILKGLRSEFEPLRDKFLAWEILSPTGRFDTVMAENSREKLNPVELLVREMMPRSVPDVDVRALAVWVHGQAVHFSIFAPLILGREVSRLTDDEAAAMADGLAESTVSSLCQYANAAGGVAPGR